MDLYSTYHLFCEIEEGKIEIPPPVRTRAMQMILDACTLDDGRWIGGNPFEDLELLLSITRDNMDHARRFLENPEKNQSILENLRINAVFERIRRDLARRFRNEGRE